ncbi:phosphotransferase family protein [Nocardia wallacei]|uniref:phosphotransferase family protein n=1 Tax=Nocardia wallacei TaxID=480035 RepID=UPI002458E890|nr:phosphotransferase family protein [Nocardia wallacei]
MTQALPGLNLAALQTYFDTHVPGTAGPLTATLLHGGKSNLTYRLSDGVHDWVLRRPPLGPLTPTAHDMTREYHILAALHGTCVPVPKPVAVCAESTVLGVPFAVVSYVPGRTVRDGDDAAALSPGQARSCSQALIDTLAALHGLDPDQVGLTGFGRPSGYLERQITRWRGQWARVATRDLPTVDQLAESLNRELPPQAGSAIVHGDYRLDNTIVEPCDLGRIAAVVDWEMATLGDPLADLGLLQVYWDPRSEPVLGVRHAPTANAGFGTADDLAERYAIAAGHDLHRLPFYRALGYFKLAVIAEGIHQRYRAGKTIGDGFTTIGSAVPVLLDAGLECIQ